jgi:ethanolamine ammonia-lyase small subunit
MNYTQAYNQNQIQSVSSARFTTQKLLKDLVAYAQALESLSDSVDSAAIKQMTSIRLAHLIQHCNEFQKNYTGQNLL